MILHPPGKHSCKNSRKDSCHTHEATHLSRDVKMSLKSGEVLRILAVENQNAVDYTMPLRCMEYDVMEYKKQLEDLKRINRSQKTLVSPAEFLCGIRVDDRLAPVYTICLYHGEEEWNGPKFLADMMKFGEDSDVLYPLFADYPFRLFCINAQTDFRIFHTELRALFMALNQRNSPEGLQKLFTEESAYRHLSKDTAEALATLLNIPRIWDFRNEYENQSEEDYDMCYAVKKWHEQDKMEGIVLGRNEGILDKTRIVVENMLKRGFSDDDIASLADCELTLIEEVRKQMADC